MKSFTKRFVLKNMCFVFLFFLASCLSVFLVSADALCSDTDNGPLNPDRPDDYSLGTAGKVRFGTFANTREDVCVSSTDVDLAYSVPSSPFLKEFFCLDDKREFRIYVCSDYGFTNCVNGSCVGKDVLSNESFSYVEQEKSLCGNRIIDEGEECDPPFSICFNADKTEYGQCNIHCQCEIANVERTKCGNSIIDEGEDCESDEDCEDFEYCKNCFCISRPEFLGDVDESDGESGLVVEEESAGIDSQNNVDSVKKSIDDKYPLPEINPPEVGDVKDFNDSPGIAVTKKTTNLFVKIWSWVVGLFS